MTIDSTQSAFLVSPENYVPGGSSFIPGQGGRAASAPLDEDRGPAGIVASGKDGESLGFGDLLDAVNPLHHLPVVGTLYRAMTGDEIGPAARVAGGTLYGGAIGAVAALANAALEESTGADLGAHVLALFSGDEPAGEPAATQVAAAKPAPAPTAATAAATATPAALAAAALPAAGAMARPTTAGGQALPGNAASALPVGQPVLAELGVGRDVPQLSPAAFQTLMNRLGATPADGATPAAPAVAAHGQGLASGAEAEPAAGPLVPAAAMEIHRLLQGFAVQGGQAIMPTAAQANPRQ